MRHLALKLLRALLAKLAPAEDDAKRERASRVAPNGEYKP